LNIAVTKGSDTIFVTGLDRRTDIGLTGPATGGLTAIPITSGDTITRGTTRDSGVFAAGARARVRRARSFGDSCSLLSGSSGGLFMSSGSSLFVSTFRRFIATASRGKTLRVVIVVYFTGGARFATSRAIPVLTTTLTIQLATFSSRGHFSTEGESQESGRGNSNKLHFYM
jgi:hypothetical protein